MQALITQEQFIARAMAAPGLPWVKWRSDWSGTDCFGLIVLWFREVHGIELGPVPQTDIASGFANAAGWVECGAEAGAIAWMAWRGVAPTHCGIVLPHSRLLHSEGSDKKPGGVRISRLAAIERMYGEIRFYRYTRC